jgi:hypothetical protein
MRLSTLQRGLRRARTKPGDGKKLVRVKVIGSGAADADREGRCAMAVVLAKGRRIELSRDFDAAQLRRVVEALEGF